MATDQRQLLAFLSNDADFRAWASGIAAQLAAAGMVQTADTGQINLATALRPAASNFAGYQMWRFDDALQATKPIFMKIEYGVGSIVDKPALAVTWGTGVNGAGSFTTVTTSTRWTPTASISKAAGNVLDSFCSGSQVGGGGGRLALVNNFDPGSGNFGMGIYVERLKNADGSAHASGAFWIGVTSSFASNQVRFSLMFHGLAPGTVGDRWPFIPVTDSNQIPNVGTDLALSPLFVAVGVWLYGLPLFYRDADLTRLVPFQMNHLGALHTYLPMGQNISSLGLPLNSAASGQGLAIPWE